MESVASTVLPLIEVLLDTPPPVRIELWDGSVLDPADEAASPGTLRVKSPDALRRMLWAPGELGLSRAYVVGDLDADGDFASMIEVLRDAAPSRLRASPPAVRRALAAAHRLGALGRPLPPPAEEAHVGGRRHSLRRDAQAISHHYDVGNDFYRIVLGPSMTYSCARFTDDAKGLDDAQAAKHDLVARKLGLHEQPGARLLDVGCGWGSMAIHAARHYDASVVGITISAEQVALARERVEQAGVADRVEIRLQDYRHVGADGRERFDAICSIGMSEHVGRGKLGAYFEILHRVLRPKGRLLNHAISSVGGSRMSRRSFIGRYVFPDGELVDLGDTVLAMEDVGFEVRDVESLREHYAKTLRGWVANLEEGWEQAVALTSEGRARVWRLYMAGSAVGFGDGGINVYQVLAVKPTPGGASAMPPVRTW